MAKKKLILICQSGGEFNVRDDGSMSYTGGDAHAIDITFEAVFEDVKFKLAEMLNLEYKSVVMKYFLPGNNRTLITLSNERDLKRMYEFHENSITADVFITGKAGFAGETLNTQTRDCGIKPAASTTLATDNSIPVVSMPLPLSKEAHSVIPNNERAQSPTGVAHRSSMSALFMAIDDADATSVNPTGSPTDKSVHGLVDMTSTPADTVKKRRRTAAWKIGANGPTIVSVCDHVGEKRKVTSQRKNTSNRSAATDDVDQYQDILPSRDSSPSNDTADAILAQPSDAPPGKLGGLWKDCITGVGQEFKSVKEFREVLQKYAVAHRFMYSLKKNDSNRASGRCIAEGCSWKIHASWDSSLQKFRIKKMNKKHTCGMEFWKSYHPKKSWLVSIIKERLLDRPHLKTKELATSILEDFGIAVNYTQLRRGIEDARQLLVGSYKEAYSQLPRFCEKMVVANPGSHFRLFTGDDSRFERLFMCFHASIQGFQNGCRPLLFLDASSLKSKYHETFLAATALDGDDGVFPVAFAVVDTENDDNWHWFLEQLRSVLLTSQPLTFVSDREKGLKRSVIELFENAHHGYSIHHLLESFKKNLKGPFHGDCRASLPISLVAAAHAIRVDGFKTCLDQIRRVSSEAYDWIMQIEPEGWTNALFKGEHYNHVTSDVREIYINWIEDVRELPIVRKIEELSWKLMELIDTRRSDSSRWTTMLTPSKEGKLQQEALQAYGLKVLFSSDTLFEVHNDLINVVDISKRDCSCLNWETTGLPCCHAIAVFRCTNRNVHDYCSTHYKVECFRSAYAESINPVSGPYEPVDDENVDSQAVQVLPPSISKPQSQEKKKETKTKAVATRTVSCTKCKEAGHNKATCKATS